MYFWHIASYISICPSCVAMLGWHKPLHTYSKVMRVESDTFCDPFIQKILQNLRLQSIRLLEGWRQQVHFTNFLAEMRFCCFGSPTTFRVANEKKMTNKMYLFWILEAFFFVYILKKNCKKKCYQNSKYINPFCLAFFSHLRL